MKRIIQRQRQRLIGLLCMALLLTACQPIAEPTKYPDTIQAVAFVRDNVLYIQPGAPNSRAVAVEDCLAQQCRILFPKWSPNGAWLLYYREALDESRAAQIRIATLDGETQTVTEHAATIRPADWSPDGTQVIYFHDTQRMTTSATMGEVRVLEVWTSDVDAHGDVQNAQMRGEVGFGDGCGGGGRSNSAELYEVEGGFAYGYLASIVEWTPGNILLFSNNCGSRGVGRFDLAAGQELASYDEPLRSLTLDGSGERWAAIDSQDRIVVGSPDSLTYQVLDNVRREEDAALEMVYFGPFSGRLYYTTLKRVGESVDLGDAMSELGAEVFSSPYFDFTQPAIYAFDKTLSTSTALWQGDGYAYARLTETANSGLTFARVEDNEALFNALTTGTASADTIDSLLPTVDVLYLAENNSAPVLWLEDAQVISFHFIHNR